MLVYQRVYHDINDIPISKLQLHPRESVLGICKQLQNVVSHGSRASHQEPTSGTGNMQNRSKLVYIPEITTILLNILNKQDPLLCV